MILARLIPKHSKKYENFNKDISVYAELIEKYNVINNKQLLEIKRIIKNQ